MRSLVLALCVLVAGCGTSPTPGSTTRGSSPSPPGASSAPSSTASSSGEPAGTTIITADSEFGTILYDASGQPIYLFDLEATSRPECYGECARAWPPVLTTGPPHATGAVQSDLLGTTRRSDGSTQITYAEHPLYFLSLIHI